MDSSLPVFAVISVTNKARLDSAASLFIQCSGDGGAAGPVQVPGSGPQDPV